MNGQCARIMTGAPLPLGADAVIRVGDSKQVSANTVQIIVTAKSGQDVRAKGENMRGSVGPDGLLMWFPGISRKV